MVSLTKKKLLLTGSCDCSIKKFQISDEFESGVDPDPISFVDHANSSITAMAATPSEDIIAFGDVDGVVSLYNIDSD